MNDKTKGMIMGILGTAIGVTLGILTATQIQKMLTKATTPKV
jgi:ABC-type lipoprotein release transport system permease subunit